MIEITAENVSVQYPVYGNDRRSIRHFLVIDRVGKTLRKLTSSTDRVGATIYEDSDGRRIVQALDDISFSIKDGDRVGLLGHNGAGKSTLLKVMSGIYEPISGKVTTKGTVNPLFNMYDGMNPEANGTENIYLRGKILGLSEAEIGEKIEEISDFTELGAYMDMPVRTYSSGMLVRLFFAIATSIKNDILIMDEMIGAGDASFVDSAQKRLTKFIDNSGILVIASHQPNILTQWCNKGMLLNHGKLVGFGPVDEIIEQYESIRNQP